jgi:DNA-binding MarR family transcriptional regulator
MQRAKKPGPSAAHQSRGKFLSASQESYLRLLTVTSHLSHQVDQLLRSFDITQPQFNVLRILAGASPAGLGRNEIAARMVTTTPDMTRLLNRMMDKGWVIRARGTEDRREVPTTLTVSGRQLLKNIDAPLASLHTEQFGAVSSPQMEHLLKLLKTIMEAESHC